MVLTGIADLELTSGVSVASIVEVREGEASRAELEEVAVFKSRGRVNSAPSLIHRR